jgi:glycosyltransferase involved in cell wall biosynthesis
MFENLKISFLHGRLGPHIMHGRLAKSVNAEFQKIDHYKIWNEGNHNRLFIIYAWIYNAFAFKNPKQYDIFLVSGPHISPIIMKFFRLTKKQKVIAHLGDETMYFLYDKWYSKVMQQVLVKLLNNYDILLCEGQMAADLAKLNGINTKTYTTYLGVPEERHSVLLKLNPPLKDNTFITISSGPDGWRTYYKGLDLMINAFGRAFESNSSLKFVIVGEWTVQLQEKLTSALSANCKKAINFVGHTKDIDKYLSEATFYYHTARGDAFPTVVLEAMAAGLIPLVSEWTGSKEVVKELSPELIVGLDEEKIASSLLNLSEMQLENRLEYSLKSKDISKKFTESFALKHYQDTFNTIIKESSTL